MADKHQLMARMNASRSKAKKIMDKEMAKTYPGQEKQQDEREEEVKPADDQVAPAAQVQVPESAPGSQQEIKETQTAIGVEQQGTSSLQLENSPSEPQLSQGLGIERQKQGKLGRKPKNDQEGKKEHGYKNLAVPPNYHHKVSVFSKLARTNSLAFVCQALDEFIEREQKAGRLPKMDI